MTSVLQGYLIAYLFWLGIPLGSLALLAIHGLTGGKWGETIREPLLAFLRTMPLFAILFIPILAGVRVLFPWTGMSLGSKLGYLNVPFFTIRAAIAFTCWIGLSLATVRRKSVPYPAASLIVYVMTMSFASWDWMMSLEPKWWSTIYAMNVISGQELLALAAAILFAVYVARSRQAMLDIGNLLLASLMFWAYLTFSQFLIIWSGNEKEEIGWYISRLQTSWRWLAAIIVLCAFFAPFLALLFRSAKRAPSMLGAIAAIVLVTQMLNVVWTIAPAFRVNGFLIGWFDVPALIAIGFLLQRSVYKYAAMSRPSRSVT